MVLTLRNLWLNKRSFAHSSGIETCGGKCAEGRLGGGEKPAWCILGCVCVCVSYVSGVGGRCLWNACMLVCVHMYECVCMCECLCVRMCMCVCEYMIVCSHVPECAGVCVNVIVGMCMSVHVHLCVCMFLYACKCASVHCVCTCLHV